MDRADAAAALVKHRETLRDFHLRQAFADDPGRAARFTLTDGDLLLDYSKNIVTEETMELLIARAAAADVEGWRARMYGGEPINLTEGRAVLHAALRSPGPFFVDGADVSDDVALVRDRFLAFADGVRSGAIAAADGGRFTDVVNIGIGGSDLGPRMAVRALTPYRGDGPNVHFVANVDGADISDTLAGLDPARTLVLVASKTFTTQETMTNAATARAWIVDGPGEDAVADHFAAISTAADKVSAFGIGEDRMFGFWDWVGGRYSVWSAIGLAVAIAIGSDNFRAFLAGGAAADTHFREKPLGENIPVVMALLGDWYRTFFNFGAHAVLPYDQRLIEFAAHLQQVDMESNGKRVTREGAPVDGPTGPVIFGEPGTNGQHAFYQLLHQGTEPIPCDILVAAVPHEKVSDHHAKLVANALAQTQALMRGRTLEEARAQLIDKGESDAEADRLAPHRVFPGNRPSNTIAYRTLDPFTLGKLLAFYELKVFVEGIIWDINSFDQWGVELGKELAGVLLPAVKGEGEAALDASTASILTHLKSF
ncbi:glucose-6-phosphate isomerase [Acuticoccus sp. MNP-M23]|uniref:glucose-6-phosphate isomerase n=1 Tax=Acuticoccus sp. MNP-M23 TaxID=3072793 RepID=UPI00281573DD|nr:glucose-6-phosphate isomerase [Acuticoccus sp. MNP-M23]WMS41145.1 glucose-6-phosphate isomerase [Acuticoccus sp. MNP-M23]